MAATKIADVIVPEVFNQYVVERTAELTNVYLGGIISNDAQLDALAVKGGKLINMPFWSDLSGDDESLDDNTALTVNNINSSLDQAALLVRGKAWGVNDLATALSGDDPMRVIGDLVADYWARRSQATLMSTLEGVFADNAVTDYGDGVGDMINPIGGVYTQDGLLDAVQTMGDAGGKLTAIAMHSRVANIFKKAKVIETEQRTGDTVAIPRIDDLRVIIDDSCPEVAGSYTSYLFGEGAIGMGNGAAPTPTETDRDSLLGEDILINRRHFLLHPRGVAFQNASVAGVGPLNSELADATNWSRVYERKNVRLAAVTGTLV